MSLSSVATDTLLVKWDGIHEAAHHSTLLAGRPVPRLRDGLRGPEGVMFDAYNPANFISMPRWLLSNPTVVISLGICLWACGLRLHAAGIERISVSDSKLIVYPAAGNPTSGSLVGMEFGDTYSGARGWGLAAGTGGVISLASNEVMRLTFVSGAGTFGPVLTNADVINADQVRYFALRARVTGFNAGATLPLHIFAPAGALNLNLPANGNWNVVRADLGTLGGWSGSQTLAVTIGFGGNFADYQNALVELDWIAVNDTNNYSGGLDYTRFDKFWNLGYPTPVYSGSLASPIDINRFAGSTDRLYQRFQLVDANHTPMGNAHYVDDWSRLTYSATGVAPLPEPASINGVDDYAPADFATLHAHCGKLNVVMNSYIDQSASPAFTWNVDGVAVGLKKANFDTLVSHIKTLNDQGMAVYLVLLNISSSATQTSDNPLIPATAVQGQGNWLGQNTFDPLGRLYYRAFIEYLASRLSGPGNGAVTGYIVGNEVDAFPVWHQVGPLSNTEFINYYAELLRLTDLAIRKYNPYSTALISLTHHWTIKHTIAPPTLLTDMNAIIQLEGDFPWGVAYHCYPEDLFTPTWWNDADATLNFNTGYITYRNIEVLPQFLAQAAFLYHGTERLIALTEQGFNTPGNGADQITQAAAYAYAYRKLICIPQIKAHVLHRYQDNSGEGGLLFGLRDTNGVQKQIYTVFEHADDPNWQTYFDPYLSSLPITNWDQAVPVWGSFNCDFNEDGFAQGWQANNQINNLMVTNGTLSGTATGSDPQLRMQSFFAESDAAARLRVRMKSDTASMAKFYWKRSGDAGFSESQTFSFPVLGDNAFHTYEVIAFTNAAWPGQIITGWRFDPIAKPGNFAIDYIHTAVPQPVVTATQFVGTNLILAGALGNPGAAFSVRSSTNLALPAASWPVVSVGVCDALGQFSVTNAVSASEPARFYLISQP